MSNHTHAMRAAAGALQQISDSNPGERGRRAGVVALVLRALERERSGAEGGAFLRQRAEREVEELTGREERLLLRRLLKYAAVCEACPLAESLVEYGYQLESTRRLEEAYAVLDLARVVLSESAEVALHAGRVARKLGERERALALYRTARELDGEGGAIGRLARIGEAVVSSDPEGALTAALLDAVVAEDDEAAAVALEERARVRRAEGEREAAASDLCFAAARFADAVDRARVAHHLADLFVAADDPLAAREAMLLALEVGDRVQREHALGRLYTVSRDLGDEVGTRRWRGSKPAVLVSLSSRPRARVVQSQSAQPRIARWRDRLVVAH